MEKTPGWSPGPTLCFTRRLCVNEYAMWVLYETVRWGSKWGGSHPRMVSTPPRLGVWAHAGGVETPGVRATAATAAAAAPPPSFSRSRRLSGRRVWSGVIRILQVILDVL